MDDSLSEQILGTDAAATAHVSVDECFDLQASNPLDRRERCVTSDIPHHGTDRLSRSHVSSMPELEIVGGAQSNGEPGFRDCHMQRSDRPVPLDILHPLTAGHLDPNVHVEVGHDWQRVSRQGHKTHRRTGDH